MLDNLKITEGKNELRPAARVLARTLSLEECEAVSGASQTKGSFTNVKESYTIDYSDQD